VLAKKLHFAFKYGRLWSVWRWFRRRNLTTIRLSNGRPFVLFKAIVKTEMAHATVGPINNARTLSRVAQLLADDLWGDARGQANERVAAENTICRDAFTLHLKVCVEYVCESSEFVDLAAFAFQQNQ
jgi:hypothetical protein